MSLPLEVGDMFIDRTKSSIFLHYITRAYHRAQVRDIHRKKVELSIKRLKKISTKNLHSHLDELHAHVNAAMARERHIASEQDIQDKVHKDLKHKITKLGTKLDNYLTSQEQRKQRIQQLESKIKDKFEGKKERIKQLKKDYKRLMTLYNAAKKAKANKSQLDKINKRIHAIQTKILTLR